LPPSLRPWHLLVLGLAALALSSASILHNSLVLATEDVGVEEQGSRAVWLVLGGAAFALAAQVTAAAAYWAGAEKGKRPPANP